MQTNQLFTSYGGSSISGRSRLRLVCPKSPVRTTREIREKLKHTFESTGELPRTLKNYGVKQERGKLI